MDADKPPQVCGHSHPVPQKIDVWAGIIGAHVLGPVVIGGPLTGEHYVELLTDEVSELLNDLQLGDQIWYMHDGAPAHNYGPATALL